MIIKRVDTPFSDMLPLLLTLLLLVQSPLCATAPQVIAQDILRSAEDSFGRTNWSVGGETHLEYTKAAIKFLDTKGATPSFHAQWFASELENLDVITQDFATHPVTTSHKTLDHDLSIASGNDSDPGHALIHSLGAAQSIWGKMSLAFLLNSPQTDVQLLRNRQQAIKAVISSPELLNETSALLSSVATHQKELSILVSSRWMDGWEKPGGRNSFSLFDLPIINKIGHSLPMKGVQYYTELLTGKIAYTAQIGLVAAALMYLANKTSLPLPQAMLGFRRHIQNRIANTGYGIVTDGDQRILSLLPDTLNPIEQWRGTRNFDALIALYVMIQLKVLHRETEWHYSCLLQTAYFLKVTQRAAQALSQIEDLYAATQACPELRALRDLEPFYGFFEEGRAADKDLAKIFSIARSWHLSTTYSPLRPAASQYLCELIKKKKDTLNSLLLAYGRLETYLGSAQLYSQLSQAPNRFCFAEYVESVEPLYQAENLWNPLLEPEKAIGSTIDFGESSGKRIYLITGANEGGKSVFLKAVPIGAVLAQTLGIVPAHNCRIAPFELIETYLNITDNVAQGHSLFRAEAVRARELLNNIGIKRSLVAFDELFNGTSYLEATALAWAVTKHLEEQPNVCGVFATHFPLLTKLEKHHPAIENRCVMMQKNDNGIWQSTYTVQPGVSEQHVALDILAREGVTGSIMETAQHVIQEITAHG